MSGEYVPTTETVRDRYALSIWPGVQGSDLRRAFDAWLSAHDAQVRAEALREAAVAIRQSSVDLDPGRSDAELSYINCTSMDAEIVLRMADDIARGGQA